MSHILQNCSMPRRACLSRCGGAPARGEECIRVLLARKVAGGYEKFEGDDRQYYSVIARLMEHPHRDLTSSINARHLSGKGGKLLRGFDFLGVDITSQASLTPSRGAQERLQEKLLFHLSQCAQLYELGRLRSLESVERNITHWLRCSKGIASSNALDAVQYVMAQLCKALQPRDVMVNTFARCILLRGKTEQIKKGYNYEKDNYYVVDRSGSHSCS